MKTAKIIVSVACAIGAVMFLAAGIVLYRGICRFNTAREDLEKVKRNLASYYEAPIFPSRENVVRELANAKQADAWFDELMATLRRGNVESDERSPSKFINVSETVRRRLTDEAKTAGTDLPSAAQAFAFGFDRYSGTGTLPKPQDVPRLTEQLVIVNRICLVMFKNRVKAVTKIERDEFEDASEAGQVTGGPEAAPRRRSSRRSAGRSGAAGPDADMTPKSSRQQAGTIGENDLFARFHFALEFRAKASALVDLLNELSAHSMFVVVTSLSLSKPSPELVPEVVDPQAGSPGGAGFGATRTAAVAAATPQLGPNYPVCGIEMEIPMDIRLELDVYKFREADVDSGD